MTEDNPSPPDGRARFILDLEGPAGRDNVRALRWLLKVSLRRFGLKAVSVRIVREG
jgi:hypothetical protein